MHEESIEKLKEFIEKLKQLLGHEGTIEVNTNYRDKYNKCSQIKNPVEIYIENPGDRQTTQAHMEKLLKSHASLEVFQYPTSSVGGAPTEYIQFFLEESDFKKFENNLMWSCQKELGTFILSYVANQKARDGKPYHMGYSEIQLLNKAQIKYNDETREVTITFPDNLLEEYELFYDIESQTKKGMLDEIKNTLDSELIHLFRIFNQQLETKGELSIEFNKLYRRGLGYGVQISSVNLYQLSQLGFKFPGVHPSAYKPNPEQLWKKQCEWFVSTVQAFKRDNEIYGGKVKSLRRDVFGVSEDEDHQMPIISELNKKFLALPGMAEFIKHPKLVDNQGKINLDEAFGDMPKLGSIEEKAKKYLSIIFGTIQPDQLNDPKKYEHTRNLYHANSDRQKITDTSYRNLIKKYNQGLWEAAKSPNSVKEIEQTLSQLLIKK